MTNDPIVWLMIAGGVILAVLVVARLWKAFLTVAGLVLGSARMGRATLRLVCRSIPRS